MSDSKYPFAVGSSGFFHLFEGEPLDSRYCPSYVIHMGRLVALTPVWTRRQIRRVSFKQNSIQWQLPNHVMILIRKSDYTVEADIKSEIDILLSIFDRTGKGVGDASERMITNH